MFLEQLRRAVASTGGTLSEFSTNATKLSQYCHGCGNYVKKPLSQRWHHCPCGIGPVQRDLYSAWLAAHLNVQTFLPSLAQDLWERAETRRLSSGRGHHPTRECGAGSAPKHGYAPCRSASAHKSCR